MWLKICVLTLCAVYSAGSVEVTPKQTVFSVVVGSSLHIDCSTPNAVQWSSNSANATKKSSLTKVEATVAGSDNISTLTFNNVQKSDEGTYWCNDTAVGSAKSIELRVFSVSRKTATYEYREGAMLHCNVEGSSRTFTYTWKKGDLPVKNIKVDSKQEFIEHENGSLEIRRPPRNFAGVYTCVATYEDNDKKYSVNVDVEYYAQPKVIPFDKSKNLVQDERLVVECKVLGYPKPTLSWHKGSDEITNKDGSRYKLSPAKTYDNAEIENAKLEIDSVDFDDAGEYRCTATNDRWSGFNSTQVILVRVKDKLAALWPFLGIVAEVVVLCTIIFIYEKKRNKDTPVEEDANQDGASPEKKAEGVRHRGSPNNPRA